MITERCRDDVDLTRGMHLLITGSGSALVDATRGGASAAVIVDGHVIQFDCGRMVMENLVKAGINPLDVDELVFTHLHFDHIASFGYFIISNWVASRQVPLRVIGPGGTARMARSMVFEGHYADVGFVQGLAGTWPEDVPGRPMATAPFTVEDVEPGLVMERDAFTIRAVPVPHFQRFGLLSLGYRVESRHGSIVISGDCAPNDALKSLAEGADILVQECAKPDGDMVKGGKLTRSTTVEGAQAEHTHPHTTPTWLGETAAAARVKAVVATHLAPLDAPRAGRAMSRVYYGEQDIAPDIFDEYARRIRRSFDGPVHIARDGLLLSV
jgi:ribonuclease BN (tRNA processing enzyme)